MTIQEREKDFYNKYWNVYGLCKVEGSIAIPGIDSFKEKKVLICSCGGGALPVQAAKMGAKVYAFDISEVGVRKAKEMADYNNVNASIEVMDFNNLKYEENYFDIIYGEDILHHVNCEIAGNEIYRCLKSEGTAFFKENSDRNIILRYVRRLLFGKPGGYQKQHFLFFKREGTTDEYPLTEESVNALSRIFKGNIQRYNERFCFFYLLNYLLFKNPMVGKVLAKFDMLIAKFLPFIRKYSFTQEILLRKPKEY